MPTPRPIRTTPACPASPPVVRDLDRRRALVVAGGGLLAGVLAGCGNKRTSDRDLVLVGAPDAEALASGRRRGLGGRRRTLVVDPRTPLEFADGHVPGAVNVPFERLRTRSDELRGYDVLLVCGETYGDPIALAASKTLIDLGFGDVRTIEGGMRAWKAEGFPVETASD